LEKALKQEGVSYHIYEGIDPDPDIKSIDDGALRCKESGCNVVIGIGGGSALDAAKSIAMLVTNGDSIREYQMGAKTITKMSLPLIAVPTTAGTGSEATKVSVVSNLEAAIKKSVAHPFMIPGIVFIDPDLMISLPKKLTASTGMDALAHAIESYVSLNANPITEAYGLKAVELVAKNLVEAVENGSNVKARQNMAIASYMGGAALNAGVGIAHMIGQPLGAVYHISHGDAISILLPVAMELNFQYSSEKYIHIAQAMGIDCKGLTDLKAGEKVVSAIKELRTKISAPSSLNEVCNADPSTFAQVVDSINRSTSHIKCNPRPIDEELIIKALKMAL
jgi:alcohol dehydrogenase class IV